MTKEYTWKADSFAGLFNKMDANKVGSEIEMLGENVTTDEIVEQAKSVHSAMHNYFEWDDTKAGHLWRKTQATHLLNHLQVTYVKSEDEEPVTVKAFVNIKNQGGYNKIETVVSDVDRYGILLNKAYRELDTVRNKYQELSEIQERLAFLEEVL